MIKIDQITTADYSPKGLGRYFVNAKHETYQADGAIKTEHKRYFQKSILAKDARSVSLKVMIPLMVALSFIFWKKGMSVFMANAIAVDATTNPGVGVVSWTHTCTGQNRTLVVPTAGINNTGSMNGTYNSIAMVQHAYLTQFGEGSAILTLINPASGAHTVSVNLYSNQRLGCGSVSFSGTDQTAIGNEVATDNASASGMSDNITISRKNSFTVEAQSRVTTTGGSMTQSSGQTRWCNQSQTNELFGAAYKQHTSVGSTALAWDSGATGITFHSIVEILEYQSPIGGFLMELIN